MHIDIFANSRIASNAIKTLKPNEYFVFGSNLSGWHNGGAALLAKQKFGAIQHQGVGLQGNSYAIPTKDYGIIDTLAIAEIKNYVDAFINFAIENRDKQFLVTEIGCGLAGLSVEEMAPLFANAISVKNIYLPFRFWDNLKTMYYNGSKCIPIIMEPKKYFCKEFCNFCKADTSYWHLPTNTPVCKNCSKKHKIKDLQNKVNIIL